ncbi:MAG: hypothetical protein KA053_00670 [Lentimicrobiaceae bacterium]|nr:hypothetical protein [Lentimicrobiaceae bacterium]
MDNWVSLLSGERFREGSMEDEEEDEGEEEEEEGEEEEEEEEGEGAGQGRVMFFNYIHQ